MSKTHSSYFACKKKQGVKKRPAMREQSELNGGAEGIRTPDPHNAIVVLYQLSYDPIQRAVRKPRAAENVKGKEWGLLPCFILFSFWCV